MRRATPCPTLRVNATPTTAAARRPTPREAHKILDECRDLTVKRMQEAFSAILDKVGDVLMDRAGRTDVREEQQLLMDARDVMRAQRPALLADFEKRLRGRIDERLSGADQRNKPDFAKATAPSRSLPPPASSHRDAIRRSPRVSTSTQRAPVTSQHSNRP